jgi:hypothetical protein
LLKLLFLSGGAMRKFIIERELPAIGSAER